MVDFRKWLLALAVVGLLLGVGASTANAQSAAFTCAAAAVPNIVRAEGVTELLGDIILNCTGGVPTAAGSPIPLQNVTVTVGGTNITSRIMDSTLGASEALLLIDEPYPGAANAFPPTAAPSVANAPTAQEGCLAFNNTSCAIISEGVGVGATGSYDGVPDALGNHYNVFQGIQGTANSITWTGVPIDAPGTAGTRIIRITNIRANASLISAGTSSLVPSTILASIAVNGFQVISLNQPYTGNVVGQIEKGLNSSVGVPGAYQQCNSVNTSLLTGGSPSSSITVSAQEGFAYAFRPQSYIQIYDAQVNGFYEPPGTDVIPQDVLNYAYGTESGFMPYTTGAGNSLDQPGGTGEFIGLADTGTQISFSVTGVGAGVNLYAPSYVYLTGPYGAGLPQGVAVLSGLSGSTGAISSGIAPPIVVAPAVGSNGPNVLLTTTGTSTSLVYQIWYSDPSVQETLSVPISVEYTSNTATNTPPTTSLAAPTSVTPSFYPISAVATASTGPIPRFVPDTASSTLFTISACTCNLLFPFVTNQAGFDTGIAIANTTDDPYGTVAQNGTVVLNYYGSTPGATGGVAPYTTQAAVPAGSELVFTLSNGGGVPGGGTPSVVVPATAGFQGYIIAQANFQYCHGFAFISDVGAQKLAEGYLAISLDIPYFPSYTITSTGSGTGIAVPIGPTGLNRTGNGGENEGH